MSFEFRVSRFRISNLTRTGSQKYFWLRPPEVRSLALLGTDEAGWVSRRQRTIHRTAGRNPKPETRNLKPFFDAEFLRKLERLHLIAKRLSWADAKGEHPSSRKGFSLEFSDYRRYQHGDDLRYVDWNIYRRLDRLLLKVFTAEEEMNIYLLGRHQPIHGRRRAGEDSTTPRKVAAALGYIGLKNLDRVGGASFSSALQAPLTLGRGQEADSQSLSAFSASLSCGGETNLRCGDSFASPIFFPIPGSSWS